MAAIYATQADFEAYVPGWVTDDATSLAKYLEAAERDVEALFPFLPFITTGTYTGHRFDTASLSALEVASLKRAVCAQAEYLIAVGDEVAIGAAPTRVKGPDFETEYASSVAGGRSRYSAKLPRELAPLRRFRARYARARV
jgi:hypothetical protein